MPASSTLQPVAIKPEMTACRTISPVERPSRERYCAAVSQRAERHRELGQEQRIEAVTDDASQARDAQNPLRHVGLRRFHGCRGNAVQSAEWRVQSEK